MVVSPSQVGEALMQIDFVTELFTYFRERNVHTCLDTSGICFDPHQEVAYRKLLSVTSLVILDIKEIDPDKHLWLTGKPLEPIIGFCSIDSRRRSSHLGSSCCSSYDYR